MNRTNEIFSSGPYFPVRRGVSERGRRPAKLISKSKQSKGGWSHLFSLYAYIAIQYLGIHFLDRYRLYIGTAEQGDATRHVFVYITGLNDLFL